MNNKKTSTQQLNLWDQPVVKNKKNEPLDPGPNLDNTWYMGDDYEFWQSHYDHGEP